jgi:hopanoid biosynthesis associated RND transporter like protein HpnN
MAEGNPHADSSPLSAPLEAVTRLMLRSPGLVLCGSVMLAVLAVLVTVNGLSFKTSRLDLLNPRSEYNRRWLAYLAEFGDQDDAVVVVRSTDKAALTTAIDDLATELAKQPELFESIFFRRDLSALQRKGLHFVPEAELAQLEALVRNSAAMIPRDGQTNDPAAALAQLNDRLEHIGSSSPEVRAAVENEYSRLAGMTLAALNPAAIAGSAGTSPSPALADLERGLAQFQPQYLLADQDRLGFVMLKLKRDEAEFARGAQAIGQLRQTIAAVRERHPAAWIGLTGMPIIEYDEMLASQSDMMWTSLVSMALVFGLFIAAYGGLRHSLLANFVLLLATAYSFGFVTLTVGHLNILSAAFSAVLIGLGGDFGIHYLARYLKIRDEGHDEESALIRTSLEVGPGMFTGGVTTAAAFFMAAMTDFVGVRELGFVAGGSILLCLLATVVVLPPLVLIVDRQWPIGAVPQIVPAGRWFRFTTRWPRLAMGAALIVTLVAAVGLGALRYDHNLLNLQPKHLESADIERQLFSQLEDSVWFAVTMCDSPADLHERQARFEALATVAKTEEIASLIPASSPGRERLVRSIHDQLAALPPALPTPVPLDARQLKHEAQRAALLVSRESPYETQAGGLVEQLAASLAQMPDEAIAARLTGAQAALLPQAFAQLSALRELSEPQPPQLADLPRELADRYVGRRGKLLLKVYARGNVWDMDRLAEFVREVESVDPRITGHPVQTYYASRHMQQSYIHTGLYAVVAVFVLLWIDLRSVLHSLLAMVPLALGFVQMCGLFGWCNLPLNPANMIVLPVIVGIAVDHGVHLVHLWRQQRGKFVLSDSTAVAMLLTATTTTASFGVLVFARHQGLQTLGQVLTLGVTTCLFSSIVFFPGLLRWLTRHRADEPPAETETNNAASLEVAIVDMTPPAEAEAQEEAQAEEEPEEQVLVTVASRMPEIELQQPAYSSPAIPRRRVIASEGDAEESAEPSAANGSSPLRHLAVRESRR